MEKKALGRGLSALIPEKEIEAAIPDVREEVIYLPISQIKPSMYQPRTNFDETKLQELVASIKDKGIVQPILVRKGADGYELIAGERRFRAAKEAGLDKMPALIRMVDDANLLEISLIENLQREDLNPIEEGKAYRRLMDEFGLTQERVAEAVGKNRATVANILRLLSLPALIQGYVSRGNITGGHARALLSLKTEKTQLMLCNQIVKKGLSVRETERLVSETLVRPIKRKSKAIDPEIATIEEELQRLLGTKVRIMHGKKKGKVAIEYYSNTDLERLINILRNGAK